MEIQTNALKSNVKYRQSTNITSQATMLKRFSFKLISKGGLTFQCTFCFHIEYIKGFTHKGTYPKPTGFKRNA